ncbi:MAG: hypothetical protein ACLPTZ_02135 [Beijerinckiaceae bacterium]|jgi:hypothetical protein
MDKRKILHQLLEQSWKGHDRRFVVSRSIPVPFFGDSERYFKSHLRVVTVGLNPSSKEFKGDGRNFSRFPIMKGAEYSRRKNGSLHLAALNAYFHNNPYRWFKSYESVLHGLDAGYYGCFRNTALHTDLCSPLATDPTWSGLKREQRKLLLKDGVALWHSLVEILNPHIIIACVAAKYLKLLTNNMKIKPDLARGKVIKRLTRTGDGKDRKRPCEVRGWLIQLGFLEKGVGLVHGPAVNKPFGNVLNNEKPQIGTAIGEWYRHARR